MCTLLRKTTSPQPAGAPHETNLDSPTVVDLILQDDKAERARLEELLNVSQEEMVNYFIHLGVCSEIPLGSGEDPATAEERLEAVRAFFRKARSRSN